MSNISNDILDGIEILIDKKIKNASFDKTRNGIVLNIEENNFLTVKIDNRIIEHVPYIGNSKVSVNSIVRVLIPENIFSNAVVLGNCDGSSQEEGPVNPDIPEGGTGELKAEFLFINSNNGKWESAYRKYNKGEFIIPPVVSNIPAIENVCPQLTFHSWNFLSDELTNIQNDMVIGATYTTTDGKTHLFIELTKGSDSRNPNSILSQSILLNKVDNTMPLYIDWGDGSGIVTISESIVGSITESHTYSTYGKYDIKIYGSKIKLGDNNCIIGGNLQNNKNILKYCYIGDSVSEISSKCFENCYSLTSVTIPKHIISVGSNAFIRCYSLEYIVLPKGITDIKEYTFSNCANLKSISLPNGIINIEGYIISESYALSYLAIPNTVNNIDMMGLNDNNLKSITLSNGLTEISGIIIAHLHTESIIIPENVKKIIGGNIIDNAMVKYISFPNGLSEFETNSFTGYSSLESVNIPTNMEIIPDNVFSRCFSLKSIIIPSSVKTIGGGAFSNCYSLVSCKIEGSSVKNLNGFFPPFFQGNTLLKIYVEDSLVEQYKTASQMWQIMANFIYPMSQYPN